ncbi:YjcQ family protein [Ignavigranum ruoffiae]|uniref:YjcQ family protein n=1 Tax=Ignavigranum ruoffiae TaxID=89093 RepID=UPI00205A1C80|nr:YjcQ family protein [Ignavigranum ruoffiae]UPQ86419.1 YjcQ family protein [Ignavigranum ruoffiae]
MSKDDYFVIVYQLLKYLYDCLKKGIQPDYDKLTASYFNIPESYWGYIIDSLLKEDFIQGPKGIPTKDGIIFNDFKGMMITPKGIQYLFDNTFLEKIKRTLKDVKDITPFM